MIAQDSHYIGDDGKEGEGGPHNGM